VGDPVPPLSWRRPRVEGVAVVGREYVASFAAGRGVGDVDELEAQQLPAEVALGTTYPRPIADHRRAHVRALEALEQIKT
jgi:deoxyribodipyrimidine photolyase